MKLKSLTLALVSAGVIAAGSASAFSWNPDQWFGKTPAASASAPTQAALQPVAPSAPVAAVAPAPAPAANNPAAIPMIAAPNYRAIVQQYAPAVVGVNVEGTMKTSGRAGRGGPPEDPFSQFFNPPGFGQFPRGQIPRGDIPIHGMGSGFIVRSDGVILTNAHVVRDASEVTVKLSDRREFKAKVLGSDAATDVAVLKIDAQNLPVVKLGNSAQLEVGDYVLAIGSPFGLEHSATSGIVSAKGRSLPGDGYVPFIQTDVAVNPGNSGGPLFDANGQVVGINSQIYSESGGYQGISFAIPIDVAMRVENQITTTGKVQHALLGVTVQQLDQTLAESFKLKKPDGALVASVTPGSAAAKAGLEPGDVILKYNGQPIGGSTDLPALVSVEKPGDKATLEVWRAGKRIELSATLAAAADTVAADESRVPAGAQAKLGVAVRPLTDDEKQEANLVSGVVIEQVGGPAARAGIQPGDVIVSLNGAPVKSVIQLRELVAKSGAQIALLIQRGEDKIFVPVKVG